MRGRVILEFTEEGEQVHSVVVGEVHITGCWVYIKPEDEDMSPTSWPAHNVICVEWL